MSIPPLDKSVRRGYTETVRGSSHDGDPRSFNLLCQLTAGCSSRRSTGVYGEKHRADHGKSHNQQQGDKYLQQSFPHAITTSPRSTLREAGPPPEVLDLCTASPKGAGTIILLLSDAVNRADFFVFAAFCASCHLVFWVIKCYYLLNKSPVRFCMKNIRLENSYFGFTFSFTYFFGKA